MNVTRDDPLTVSWQLTWHTHVACLHESFFVKTEPNRTEHNTTEESFWRWLPDRVTASRVPNISALWLVHDGNSTFWMLRNLSTNLQSNFGLKEKKKTRNKSGGKERGGKREREDEEEENSQRVTTPFERTTFIDTMQITRWLTTDNWQIHACNFFIPTFSSLCHWASPAEASAPAAGTGCPPHSDATSVSLGQVSINHVSGG